MERELDLILLWRSLAPRACFKLDARNATRYRSFSYPLAGTMLGEKHGYERSPCEADSAVGVAALTSATSVRSWCAREMVMLICIFTA